MVSISVSARSLAAARLVDPQVSTAAVHAAIEEAVAADRREARREAARITETTSPRPSSS
ncbi:MAG: hypothetical protein L0I76_21475 [Pseudonocardia sp.]|nr:hypothetical protein [Pseudonocardia sp.]